MEEFKINNKYLFEVLRSIKYNSSLDVLLNNGLDYFQIVKYIEVLIKLGYVVNEKNLLITDLGDAKIVDLYNTFGSKKEFITPKLKAKIEKISKYSIYIPKNKTKL